MLQATATLNDVQKTLENHFKVTLHKENYFDNGRKSVLTENKVSVINLLISGKDGIDITNINTDIPYNHSFETSEQIDVDEIITFPETEMRP